MNTLSIMFFAALVSLQYSRPALAFTSRVATSSNHLNLLRSISKSGQSSSSSPSSSSSYYYSSTRLFSTDKARILFLGTPEVAATSLTKLVEESQKDDSTYEVVGVVTQPPKRRKRRGKEIPSPVGMAAAELDIPVLTPEKAKDADFLDQLEQVYRPDLCITAAYGQYLPKRFLAIPKFGTLNIHPSLLPRWRGASPVQRSLQAGDNPVGVSLLFTVSKMDAGPIVSQTEQIIGDNDDATKLLPQLFEIGTDLLVDALPQVIQGSITMDNASVQDDDKIVNADMIHSSEGELFVWKDSAMTCHNKVRGFSMWPGTFFYVRVGDDEQSEPIKMKIVQTRVLDPSDVNVDGDGDKDGEADDEEIVLGPKKGDGLRVVCADGSILELMQVQPVTRKVMDAKSFVNGLRGERVRWVKMPVEEEQE